MNQPDRPLTLHDLLARRWRTEAPITAIRFATDGGATAFATAAGAVLIAGAADPEPPESRIRVTGDLGQTTIRPRTKEPPALVPVTGLADGAPPIAARGSGFLVGDAAGRVLELGPDGAATTVLTLEGPVVALDQAGGAVAAADAGGVTLLNRDGARRRDLPGTVALALHAGGGLAAADAGAVRLLGRDDASPAVPLAGALRLRWRGDGAWLGAALGAEGIALVDPAAPAAPIRLGGFPAPARDLVWSAPGHAFAAPGAFRVAAWDAEALPATDRPLLTGQPGLVAVEALAAHPSRPLLAAGFANGQVVIAQIGARDELLLRHEGAAVTALAFSPDGRHLAIGDAAGVAAIATFPARMFK
ncbi:WD40 repeat domain-containing protein [Amaricoccus solimangrovi]|uniref:Anaphase-promoting complex subunit 4 WD40 domain-containing protein n=1 Tax=Amaricoccus solimangrovi TaxID=2589815 RepID=A0A501WM18_9RHOB|nr:hypothetical protein [Amaricoccus solimangrovi]TPE49872.1 hypothetical protein FJM51_12970 [Amaricoccus solimangrovi]